MPRFFLILVSFVSSLTAVAQGKDFRSFIPPGYDTLYDGVARGDLNKDGKEDLVLALFHKSENIPVEQIDRDSIPARQLLILFATDKGYAQVAGSDSALLCKNCGGAFGDPFAGIDIQKGILLIYHYGGSAWRWAYTHKFRWQDGGFFLIGRTTSSSYNVLQCEKLGEPAGLDFEDVNFVTGQFERKKISENCKLLENKKGKQKIEPLIPLTSFSIED